MNGRNGGRKGGRMEGREGGWKEGNEEGREGRRKEGREDGRKKGYPQPVLGGRWETPAKTWVRLLH